MSYRGSTAQMRNEILAEASTWFVELEEHPREPATRAAFDGWLRRSPEHVHAYLRIAARWEGVALRPSASIPSIDALVALGKTDVNVVPLTAPGAPQSVPPGRDSAVNTGVGVRSIRWRFALAASVLLSLVLGGAIVWQHFLRGVYSTEVGELRSFTLADGSTAELNSRSRIRVRYTDRERHIDLLEGQALFSAAQDSARPFIVRSHDVHVRAVGTRFDVRLKDRATVVTVIEGRVAVRPAASARSSGEPALPHAHSERPVLVAAGEQVTVTDAASGTGAAIHPHAADIELATAWTERRLIFMGAPLSEVVGEFNRYNAKPLVITDSGIATTQISGSFSSNNPDALLRFLREVGAYRIRETPSAFEIYRR